MQACISGLSKLWFGLEATGGPFDACKWLQPSPRLQNKTNISLKIVRIAENGSSSRGALKCNCYKADLEMLEHSLAACWFTLWESVGQRIGTLRSLNVEDPNEADEQACAT